MNDGNDEDYKVGYCRPPKTTRFPPGKSGYPSGTRLKLSARAGDFEKELVTIQYRGRPKRVTIERAILMNAEMAAATGGSAEVSDYLTLKADYGPNIDEPPVSSPVFISGCLGSVYPALAKLGLVIKPDVALAVATSKRLLQHKISDHAVRKMLDVCPDTPWTLQAVEDLIYSVERPETISEYFDLPDSRQDKKQMVAWKSGTKGEGVE